jgi:hypothetical protein
MNPAKPGERKANDFYATPYELALAICEELKGFLKPTEVIEPSAGDGVFVQAVNATWPDAEVLAVEPYVTERRLDLRAEWLPETWEQAAPRFAGVLKEDTLIIGNPPFVAAEEHARKALEILPLGGHLVFVLRASILAGKDRVEGFWKECRPSMVWHLAPRPSFTGNGKSDGAEYTVVIWRKGFWGKYQGDWLTWVKPSRRKVSP